MTGKLIIVTWITILYYIILSKVGGQLMLNPDWSHIYIELVSKRNTVAASTQLRPLDRSTIAIASS